ncbi:unnamed protein product [Cyprideis torosa]|uniref:Uncharacterized protein n=1 Tax=Cyprideis torosa TaxID=163714 RepID=A0A7R8WFV4_9CRUS|nr:unnamed protein product [Cyprideis torosa]CAG0897356.1 unnamed protein product [Cyprideis torosa]
MPDTALDTCRGPSGFGECRYLRHCVMPEFTDSVSNFEKYICFHSKYVGVCCHRQDKAPYTDVSATNCESLNSDKTCGERSSLSKRIAGGEPAKPRDWPWAAALFQRSNSRGEVFICGGVLLSRRHVLTAAHCVMTDAKNLIVRLGEFNFTDGNATTYSIDAGVEKIILHENYNSRDIHNDIAIIVLEKLITYTCDIWYVCYPVGIKPFNLFGRTAMVIANQPKCPKFFTGIGSSCYFLALWEPMQWDLAKATCEVYGGYLAELETRDEIQTIQQFLLLYEPLHEGRQCSLLGETNGIFIGVKQLRSGALIWARSEKAVIHFDWYPGEPDRINIPNTQVVIALSCANGCGTECPELYSLVGESCYFLALFETANWSDAKKTCASFNGHLAELQTRAQINAVKNYLLQWAGQDCSKLIGPDGRIYGIRIGAEQTAYGTYVWSRSQNPIFHYDWEDGEPNARTFRQAIDLSCFKQFAWEDNSVDDKQFFLCEADLESSTLPRAPPSPTPVIQSTKSPLPALTSRSKPSASEKGVAWNGICYQYVPQQKTYWRAAAHCDRIGGRLADISEGPEVVHKLWELFGPQTERYKDKAFWIGAHATKYPEAFTCDRPENCINYWEDFVTDPSVFAESEPQNSEKFKKDGTCGNIRKCKGGIDGEPVDTSTCEFSRTFGRLFDTTCERSMGFVCQFDRKMSSQGPQTVNLKKSNLISIVTTTTTPRSTTSYFDYTPSFTADLVIGRADELIRGTSLEELSWSDRLRFTSDRLDLELDIPDGLSTKTFPIGFNEPDQALKTCRGPNGFGECRYLRHCVLPSFQRDFQELENRLCFHEKYVGVCCEAAVTEKPENVEAQGSSCFVSSKELKELGCGKRPGESPFTKRIAHGQRSNYFYFRLLLSTSTPTSYFGTNATVVGWGRTETLNVSQVLLQVKVEIFSESECNSILQQYNIKSAATKYMVCARARYSGGDSCQGDSGGPLMVQDDEKWYVIGIVSFGVADCGNNATIPGVYTRVDKYTQWITNIVSADLVIGRADELIRGTSLEELSWSDLLRFTSDGLDLELDIPAGLTTKTFPIGFNEPDQALKTCRGPNGLGECRYLRHCVLPSFQRDFQEFENRLCFHENWAPEKLLVRLGEYDFKDGNRTSYAVDFDVDMLIPHKEYKAANNIHDIGIIVLAQRAKFSCDIFYICYPVGIRPPSYFGTNATVVGWGRTETLAVSQVLLQVKVEIFSESECSSILQQYKIKSTVAKYMVCARARYSGGDSCQGDSGGPLMVQDDEKWYVIGIVSFGVADCGNNATIPGVYTRVDKYTQWITNTMAST